MLQLLTIWSHRKSMSFDLKMRSMRRIKTSKKRLSDVHHQSKMRSMWRASWCSKQKLSNTSTENEEDEIDESRRNLILFDQADADADQTRCHALLIFFRDSFFIQQCRKRKTRSSERSLERFSERLSERLSEQNLALRIIIIIRINITINIIRISSMLFRCDLRRRRFFSCDLRRLRRLRCCFRSRCCSRRHTAFYDFSHDFVSAIRLTDNNNTNERTKSTNNDAL